MSFVPHCVVRPLGCFAVDFNQVSLQVVFPEQTVKLQKARERWHSRSESYPDGLQGLSEREEERVKEANMSYVAMVELLLILIGFGIAVSVENPLNSLFWMTSFMQDYLTGTQDILQILQHCMHGGARDKKSKFCRTTRGSLMRTFWRAWAFYVTNHTNMNLGNHVGLMGRYFFPQQLKHLMLMCYANAWLPCAWMKPTLVEYLLARPSRNNSRFGHCEIYLLHKAETTNSNRFLGNTAARSKQQCL